MKATRPEAEARAAEPAVGGRRRRDRCNGIEVAGNDRSAVVAEGNGIAEQCVEVTQVRARGTQAASLQPSSASRR